MQANGLASFFVIYAKISDGVALVHFRWLLDASRSWLC